MRIIRNGEEVDVVVITYFTLNKTSFLTRNAECSKYILYTDELDTDTKTLHLSKVFNIDGTINLILPDKKELDVLKPIISNFLADESTVSVVVKNKYEYISVDELKDEKIIEASGQKIEISKKKYLKLLANKYLTYPDMKLINMGEIQKEGLGKYNKIAKPVSLVIVLMFFLITTVIDSKNISSSIFSLTMLEFLQTADLAKLIFILILSIVSYNNEDKKIYFSFIVSFISITLLLLGIKNFVTDMSTITLLPYALKDMSMVAILSLALIYSILLTVVYYLSKVLSFLFVSKLKIRNYLTYCASYITLFTVLGLGALTLYNEYITSYIDKILAAI